MPLWPGREIIQMFLSLLSSFFCVTLFEVSHGFYTRDAAVTPSATSDARGLIIRGAFSGMAECRCVSGVSFLS